ncbi:hypothetical protein AB0D08_00530 [Kitasatospora sp. NPDC048540]|uniref:hypothetical protein n=1 Tax=Kitasatospora sp. NPDC048540 TaxID=3155634 RepID=UPI0033C9B79B
MHELSITRRPVYGLAQKPDSIQQFTTRDELYAELESLGIPPKDWRVGEHQHAGDRYAWRAVEVRGVKKSDEDFRCNDCVDFCTWQRETHAGDVTQRCTYCKGPVYFTQSTETEVRAADAETYRAALAAARRDSERIADATSAPDEMPENGTYFLTDDLQSGFGISPDLELIGLFSLVKGRGECLITEALTAGAERLDCFDGFLPKLYERFGFRETERVANWTPGEPDVVFMALV